jgi:hypothetical protein
MRSRMLLLLQHNDVNIMKADKILSQVYSVLVFTFCSSSISFA